MATSHSSYAGLAQNTFVRTSLVATYRSTAAFYIHRDQMMKKYYGDSFFEHWSRSDQGFSLVSPSKRCAIRCESNRLIVRSEGHSSYQPFEELLSPMKDMVTTFEATDIFAVSFTSTRVLQTRTLKQARTTFAEKYLAPASLNLLKANHQLDYAVILQRNWYANRQLDETTALNDPRTVLDIEEHIALGPVSRQEIAEKFLEFKKNATAPHYSVEPRAPEFGIAGDMKFTVKRHPPTEALATGIVWDIYSWARTKADDAWSKITGV